MFFQLKAIIVTNKNDDIREKMYFCSKVKKETDEKAIYHDDVPGLHAERPCH